MRRRLPAALLALCLTLTLLPGDAWAADSGSCGDGLTFQINYSGTLTISGKGAMSDYTSGTYPPWGRSSKIKRVVINQGATRIGDYAFYNCPNLEEISIPSSVTAIGQGAFEDCTGLTSVTLPDSITRMGESAFRGCVMLASVKLSSGLKYIASSAFSGCTGLTSITVPDGVTELEGAAFFECSALTSVTLPDSLEAIRGSAFLGCTSLASIAVPACVGEIGTRTFWGCTSLTSIILPAHMYRVVDDTFKDCVSLESVELPHFVDGDSISSSAFAGCSALRKVQYRGTEEEFQERKIAGKFDSAVTFECLPENHFHTVTFSGRFASGVENLPQPITVLYQRSISKPAQDPTITGYRFTGWYISPEDAMMGANKYSFTTPVRKDITLYAGWDPIICTVKFYCNNGDYWYNIQEGTPNPYSKKVQHGAAVREPGILPAMASHTLTGWYTEPECQNKWDLNNDRVTGPLNLYAGWKSNTPPPTYTVTFDSQGGSAVASQTIQENGVVTKPANPTYTGHTFEGWYQDEDCRQPWDFENNTVTGNLTLYAGWTYIPPTYTVTFDSQGGSAVSSQTIQENGTVKKPADPTYTGHIFEGWYQDEDCRQPWDFENNTVTGNLTLYAGWTYIPPTYTVTFDSQGGSAVSSQTIQENGVVTKPADPTYTGHTFKGWYKEASCTTPWNFDTDTVTENTTLYAKWTVQFFRVAFDLNSGEATGTFPDVSVAYGQKIPAPTTVPNWTGHTFEDWYRERACTTPWDFDSDTVTENTTLYAGWTEDTPPAPGSCTVAFDLNYPDAPAPTTVQVTIGGKIPRPAVPARNGYAFEGWYEEEVCSSEWNFDTGTVTGDITLFAKWSEKTTPKPGFVITFDRNDGQGGVYTTRQTDENGFLNSMPPGPAPLPGYTFEGWYDEKTGGTEIPVPCQFHRNFTLYAHWTEDQPAPGNHTVTFDAQGGSTVASQTVKDGQLAKKPADPAYAGHTFEGWYKEASCTTPWDFDSDTVTGDVTLYAKWTAAPKTYTVTLEPNGGTLPAGQSATLTTGADGKLAALPASPVRPGYTFDGWFTQQTGGTAVTTATVFTKNAAVYAHWTAAAGLYYRIYAPDRTPGGSLYVSHTLALAGTRVTVEPAPRRGYELDWLSVTDLATGREIRLWEYGMDEYIFTMPAADVEVEAVFSFRNTGGSSSGNSGGSSGGSTPAPAPQPAGRTPVRWYYSGGAIYHVVDGRVPDGTWLTRDMLISVLYNLDDTSSGEPEFWATSRQVIPDIYKSWLWGADKAISREQAAVILFSYAQYKNYNNFERADLSGYTDRDLILPIAQPAVSWARATGLITGTSAKTLSPKGRLTARQGGVIIARFTGGASV